MLNLLLALLIAACIAVYIITGKMLASDKKYMTDLDETEREQPLASWYNPDLHLDEPTMSSLRPFGSTQALPWAERIRLTAPDCPQGNGFHTFPDKSGYARIQVNLPGLNREMLDWWYAWVGFEPIRYKIWFPGRHIQALYAKEPKDGVYSLGALQGHILYSIERIGRNAPLQKLEYLVVNPADWGLAAEQGAYFVCQEVKNGPFKLAKLILRFVPNQDGLAAVAHIWLGDELLKVLRPYLAGGQGLYDWSCHIGQELKSLPAFLPQIFSAYQA